MLVHSSTSEPLLQGLNENERVKNKIYATDSIPSLTNILYNVPIYISSSSLRMEPFPPLSLTYYG